MDFKKGSITNFTLAFKTISYTTTGYKLIIVKFNKNDKIKI